MDTLNIGGSMDPKLTQECFMSCLLLHGRCICNICASSNIPLLGPNPSISSDLMKIYCRN